MPKTNTTPPEHQEQATLVQWLKIKKIDYFAIPNAQALSSLNKLMAIRAMNKLKAEGLVSGTSDICVFTSDYILFIEMKKRAVTTKTGKRSVAHTKVSDNQKKFLEMVEQYGYVKSSVCYGFIEAKTFIEQYQ